MADDRSRERTSSSGSEHFGSRSSSSYGTHNDISSGTEKAGKIDLIEICKDTFRSFIANLWLLLILAAVFSAALCLKAKKDYSPRYTAQATFTVNVLGISGNGSDYYSQGTASQLSVTFPSILTSGILSNMVCEDMGVKALPASISAYVEGSTALFTIKTTASDPDSAYLVLKSVIKVYPEVARFVVGNTELLLLHEPELPKEPDNTISYGLSIKIGCAAALAVCLVIALLVAVTRKTIRNTNDLKSVFNLRCIGSVPFERSVKHGKRKEFTSIANEKASKNFVDSIRLIRSRTEKSMQEHGEKVLLIASSIPGEGKTTISVNIALALAEKGKHVVLVDCDIRKPSVIGGFRDLADKGLVDYLLHEAEYDEIIGHKNEYLDVINGIRNSNFAADLLKSENMRNLVERLRGEYDYVILDSPPSALMADAQSMVGIADCAIYVVCQDYTRKSRIIDGMNNLSSPNLRFIGYVLNNSSSSTNYGKYGKYSYGKYSFDKYSYGKYGYGAYGAYSKPKSE